MSKLSGFIDELLKAVPDNDTSPRAASMRAALGGVRSSAVTAAPEMEYIHWDRVYDLLDDVIGVDRLDDGSAEDWEKEVERIYVGGME